MGRGFGRQKIMLMLLFFAHLVLGITRLITDSMQTER
jgi:hypothetical protein